MFQLDDFILTAAPAASYTVVAKDAGNLAAAAWLFSLQPAVSAAGRLTFTVRNDRYGTAAFEVTATSGGTSVKQELTLEMMPRNQQPEFSVHSEYRVFQNTGENSIASAIYAVSPGSSFGYPTKSVDDEAVQTLSFSVATDRPGLFAPGAGPVLLLTSDRRFAQLSFTVAPGEFGSTVATVLLKDSKGGALTRSTVITVAAVDEPPSFTLMPEVAVQEDAGCRAHFDWVTGGGVGAWARESGCPHVFSAVAVDVRAGGPDEVCVNCVGGPACSDPVNCKYQRLSFVLDDVSDPLMFHALPHLDLDGTLHFSLNPDAAGAPRVVFRLVDDGDVWAEPTATTRECRSNSDACGPSAATGIGLAETGTNTSVRVAMVVRIAPANDTPQLKLQRLVNCSTLAAGKVCGCPSSADSFLETPVCRVLPPPASLDAPDAPPPAEPHMASVAVLENSGEERHLANFASDLAASAAVQGGMNVFSFSDDGALSFDETRKDPILGTPGLDLAAAFAMSPDRRHVYTADLSSDSLSILDHARGDARMTLLDRRGHGEERVRFLEASTVATQDPCSASPVEAGDRTFVGIAQGCEDVAASRAFLPSAMPGDAARVEPLDDAFGYLWENTVCYYKLAASYARGEFSRAARGKIPCVERYPVFTKPAAIRDARGLMPDATLGGIDVAVWYNCREKTLADSNATDQVTTYPKP